MSSSQTSSKHTPAPWRCDDNGQIVADNINDDEPTFIAELGYDMEGTGEANEKLIIAAPEMLQGLYQAKKWLEGWASAETELAYLNKIIEKAEGVSNEH